MGCAASVPWQQRYTLRLGHNPYVRRIEAERRSGFGRRCGESNGRRLLRGTLPASDRRQRLLVDLRRFLECKHKISEQRHRRKSDSVLRQIWCFATKKVAAADTARHCQSLALCNHLQRKSEHDTLLLGWKTRGKNSNGWTNATARAIKLFLYLFEGRFFLFITYTPTFYHILLVNECGL